MRYRRLLMLGFLALGIGAALAGDVRVRPYRAYCASVTDTAVIRHFIEQQSIPEQGHTDSLEIIDASGNGFGENDLIIVYPSKHTYSLMSIEEPLKTMMTDWHYNTSQLTSPDTTAAQLFTAARTDTTGKGAFHGLLGFILRGLELYYGGEIIEGSFRRDQNSSFLELWNYDPQAFKFRESVSAASADTIQNYDLLQIVSHDTLELSDSTMYDVIFVYKTIHDTVYVAAEAPPPGDDHAK